MQNVWELACHVQFWCYMMDFQACTTKSVIVVRAQFPMQTEMWRFLELEYLQIMRSNGVFHYTPSIWGYFRKPLHLYTLVVIILKVIHNPPHFICRIFTFPKWVVYYCYTHIRYFPVKGYPHRCFQLRKVAVPLQVESCQVTVDASGDPLGIWQKHGK